MDEPRRVHILKFRDVDETVKGFGDATMNCAPIVRACGIADYLKASAVMVLNQPDG